MGGRDVTEVSRAVPEQRSPDMIERVAIVICQSDGIGWDGYNEQGHERFRKQARLAIAAMRKPTEAMIEVAHNRLAGDGDIRDLYVAMIDAALGVT